MKESHVAQILSMGAGGQVGEGSWGKVMLDFVLSAKGVLKILENLKQVIDMVWHENFKSFLGAL